VTARYIVAAHTQVNVGGTVYGTGEEVSLPEEVAAPLLLAGTVTEAAAKAAKAKGATA